MTSTTGTDAWKRWCDDRVVNARAPHGPLALTGTYWLSELEGGVPGVPGRWERRSDGDGTTTVTLTAARHDGLEVDNQALDGRVDLSPDTTPVPSRISHGGRRLQLILREGEYAVRVFDPASPARAAFAGIDTWDHDPQWERAARFTPYEAGEGTRTVRVPNADGRERGLVLVGTIAFGLPGGGEHSLHVGRNANGTLQAVFRDAGGGKDGAFPFRFVTLPAPAADGSTVLDLNRAHLPPCAFAAHFICPFPPPGNTLAVAVPAGERKLLTHGRTHS